MIAERIPLDIRAMTWEELEAAGLCDCGRPLDECPGLPKPGPWRGWTSTRRWATTKQQLGGRRTAAVQPTVFRSRRRPALPPR